MAFHGLSLSAVRNGSLLILLSLAMCSCAPTPKVEPASGEALSAIQQIKVPDAFSVDLVAAEPDLANPVCFTIDEKGRFYVAETFRFMDGVLDVRARKQWADPEVVERKGERAVRIELLNEELASQSTEESISMLQRHFGSRARSLSGQTERIRLIEAGQNGRPAKSVVFADGFDQIGQGVGAGLLVRKGKVWYSCIPDLWLLQGKGDSEKAEKKTSLQHGFGVRVGFAGHDLHGLRMGPDGKLYFSVGDRGANLTTREGRSIKNLETGAIYRCDPDGSNMELFASGLRNPQELAFDKHGNLWTVDNNSDGGDPCRLVYVVEGGDSGWRIGYQFLEWPVDRGAWMSEGLCQPRFDGQPASIVPPIATFSSGPAGLTYNPGSTIGEEWKDHFFLCDFTGDVNSSRVHGFAVKPNGASFEMSKREDFLTGVVASDVEFGPDGSFYVLNWPGGMEKSGKGRIYRVRDSRPGSSAAALETKKLIEEGMEHRTLENLRSLLGHTDQRVRQEAQFALVEKGGKAATDVLLEVAIQEKDQLARIHALWGLGQIVRRPNSAAPGVDAPILHRLMALLKDEDAEIRAQCAQVLGYAGFKPAFAGLTNLLMKMEEPRAQSFAAAALGRLGSREAFQPLVDLMRSVKGNDPYLRHSVVVALERLQDVDSLLALANDPSANVRLTALLVLRRLARPEIGLFLRDTDPQIVAEAARAINDASIYPCLAELGSLLNQTNLPEPVLRRAVNARFRLGDPASAEALANFAAMESHPDVPRIEALRALAQWDQPFGRDVVTGLWRPLSSRDINVAKKALSPHIAAILASSKEPVRSEGAQLASRFELSDVSSILVRAVRSSAEDLTFRLASLRAIAKNQDTTAHAVVNEALNDPHEAIRIEATKLFVTAKPTEAVAILSRVLDAGTLREKQQALRLLHYLDSESTTGILAKWLNELKAGKVPQELELDLIRAAKSQAGDAIKSQLQEYETARGKMTGIDAFRNVVAGGDASGGRAIFFQGEAMCARCHRMKGVGGEMGPDLTGIGGRATREHILQSILFPNHQIAETYELETLTLKDGTTILGKVQHENEIELSVSTPTKEQIKIATKEIASRAKALSTMPDNYKDLISPGELRDLVEFLATSEN